MKDIVTLLENFGITLYVQCSEYEPTDYEIDGIHTLTASCNPIKITALDIEIDKAPYTPRDRKTIRCISRNGVITKKTIK